jgi:uncharacterized membrane protein YgcG
VVTRAFTDRQAADIRRALRHAEAATGLRFSVYVGAAGGEPGEFARSLHAALGADADRAVLVFVDPDARTMRIVTGERARAALDDRTCAIAVMSMTASFGVGDLTDGICDGVHMLAEHARSRNE